jgi:ubiquinone/menaquinone biosynthesis C-methylase UbiE
VPSRPANAAPKRKARRACWFPDLQKLSSSSESSTAFMGEVRPGVPNELEPGDETVLSEKSASMNSAIRYHLEELEIARDPNDPRHSMPLLSTRDRAILDIGCGIGQTFVAAGVGGERFAVGVDVDFDSLSYGRAHFRGIAFVKAEAERLPFKDASFDLVVSRVSLPYTDIPRSISAIRRVLRNGGGIWFVLHRASMIVRRLTASLRARRVKDVLYCAYVLANGMLFHFFGLLLRAPVVRRRETFQTRGRMRKLLKAAGFSDISLVKRRDFIVTATKAAREVGGA